MNEFVAILKLINKKNGNWKIEILKIFKSNGYKKFLTLVIIFFQVHLRNIQKKLKQNHLNDCKVKILENQSEFDILTKDSVWNIEKWTLKKRKK